MANDVFGLVGETIAGVFAVETVVAEGGFAVVYRARHSGFHAPVALKCLKIPQHLSADEQESFQKQFHEEAELLFKLSAAIPTVVRPLQVETIIAPNGAFMPFMALEWLEGESLDRWARRRRLAGRRRLSLRELVRLLSPVAEALRRAHSFDGPDGMLSIVHRDVKPHNIFIATMAGGDVVKILDFGIGRAKSVASQVAGRASQAAGATPFTPAYGAPEQWLPKRFGQTGPWTDVWGLALTLVELLAERPVIDGDEIAMMGAVLDPEARPTPRGEGLEVSDPVEAIFARALAVDPRERFADVGVFWDALAGAVGLDETRLDGRVPRDDRTSSGTLSLELQTVEVPAPPAQRARERDALEWDLVEARASVSPGPRDPTPAPLAAPPASSAPPPTGDTLEWALPDAPDPGPAPAPAPGASPPPFPATPDPDFALDVGGSPPGEPVAPLATAMDERPPPPDLAIPDLVPTGPPPAARGSTVAVEVSSDPGGELELGPPSGAPPKALDSTEPPAPLGAAESSPVEAGREPDTGSPERIDLDDRLPPMSSRPASSSMISGSPPGEVLSSVPPSPAGARRKGSSTAAPPPGIVEGHRGPLGLRAAMEPEPSMARSLARRLGVPVTLIVAGVLIRVVEGAYASTTGRIPLLGPVQPAWVAAALVVLGIAALVYRLLPEE